MKSINELRVEIRRLQIRVGNHRLRRISSYGTPKSFHLSDAEEGVLTKRIAEIKTEILLRNE